MIGDDDPNGYDTDDSYASESCGAKMDHVCTGNTAHALRNRGWHWLFDDCRNEGDQLLNTVVEMVCL